MKDRYIRVDILPVNVYIKETKRVLFGYPITDAEFAYWIKKVSNDISVMTAGANCKIETLRDERVLSTFKMTLNGIDLLRVSRITYPPNCKQYAKEELAGKIANAVLREVRHLETDDLKKKMVEVASRTTPVTVK